MRKRLIFVTLMLLCGITANYANNYTTNEHGITIVQSDGVELDITIYDEEIIRVERHAKGVSKSTLPNYVIEMSPKVVDWKVAKKGKNTILSTDKLQLTIARDGVIEYRTDRGELLLRESSYKPQFGEYRVTQSFEAGDEAIYGLGQFQSGVMNWRGVSQRLQQYNQEVAVPVILSTKGYGIYWNNYSVTDFNPAEGEIPFVGEAIQNMSEAAQGLDFEEEDVANSKRVRKIKKSIRQTTFTPTESGEYSFLLISDKDGRRDADIQLIIDRDTVINYTTTWAPQTYSGSKELVAGKSYRITLNNGGSTTLGELRYNTPSYNKTTFASTQGAGVDYLFMGSGDMHEVMELNAELTGHAPLFDLKGYGFWQCRERYHTQAELLENAREMRKREVPVDIIVQDWFYWPKGTKGPEWDRAKYPNPEEMARELKEELDMELLVSVWPEVKNEPLLKKYGIRGRKLSGRDYVDIYDERVAQQFYRMASDSMFSIGVSGVWLDGTEPQRRPAFDSKVGGGKWSFGEVANPYSLLVSQAMYNGMRAEFPNKRVMNLTRSSFVGQQRYGSVVWSGDVAGTWEQLSEQIPAGINYSVTGAGYWTHDIGGFFRDSKSENAIYDNQYTNPEYIELLTRWFQFGALSPIFRIHGYNSKTEIWRYGAAFEATARKFIDLRYRLLPYIYSTAWQMTREGEQLMTPLAMHYPKDRMTWSIKDQYLFGESLMVAIVTNHGARTKEVYLPKGVWYDYWSDAMIQGGGTVTVDTPLDSTPIFVKAGAVMAYGGRIQHADDVSKEPLQIKIYAGADGEFTLYFDDKRTYGYERGEYSEVEIEYDDRMREVEIEVSHDGYRKFQSEPLQLEIVMAGEPSTSRIVEFRGKKLKIKL